jgi:hypothetical protein
MIFKDIATQKNDSQKLADISSNESSNKVMSNELWSELSETSEAAVSGGAVAYWGKWMYTYEMGWVCRPGYVC